MSLFVHSVGPAVAVQDLGRPGFIALGLTQGGAADRLALYEGAALLGQDPQCAALEMVGTGGVFEAETDLTIALTGAAMRTRLDGQEIAWNGSHALRRGQMLEIGPTLQGTYGYLHVAGGFDTPRHMNARATHSSVGLGALLHAGERLPVGAALARGDLMLPRDARFSGGPLRIMPSMQTDYFSPEMQTRLTQTTFLRDPRGDRQGIRLSFEGPPFAAPSGLSVVSEVAVPGDVQISGEGQPFILLSESQTTAGYPRIATVLPCDVPRAVQCPAGTALSFAFVSFDKARQIEARARKDWQALSRKVQPRVRAPEDIANLREYNLISGAITGA